MEISPNNLGLSGILGEWNIDTEAILEQVKGKIYKVLDNTDNFMEKEKTLINILHNGLDSFEKDNYLEILIDKKIVTFSEILSTFKIRMDHFYNLYYDISDLNINEKNIFEVYSEILNGDDIDSSELEIKQRKYELLKDYIKEFLNK